MNSDPLRYATKTKNKDYVTLTVGTVVTHTKYYVINGFIILNRVVYKQLSMSESGRGILFYKAPLVLHRLLLHVPNTELLMTIF